MTANPASVLARVPVGVEPTPFVVLRDKDPSYSFDGWFIAEVTSAREKSYRWTELNLWITVGGKLILQQIGRTLVDGEDDFYKTTIHESVEDLVAKEGHGRLTLKIYRRLGVETVHID